MDGSHLLDKWLLDTEELALVSTRTTKNQLAFAILLKYFSQEGYFFEHYEKLPQGVVSTLAEQLGVSPKYLKGFDWRTDNTKRFRTQIRNFYGYRTATVNDGALFIDWLIKEILPQAPSLPQCRKKAPLFFKEHKLEPFSDKECDTYIKTARYRFERELLETIFKQLPEATIKSLDELLCDDEETDDNEDVITETTTLRLRHFKRESIGTPFQIALGEIAKLKVFQTLCLPQNTLKALPRKIIKKYHTRIMADFPSTINEREPLARYATMAIFCYLRTQIITDNLGDLLLRLILMMRTKSESYIKTLVVKEVTKTGGKFDILMRIANAAVTHPKGIVDQVIYPEVKQETLQNLVEELRSKGRWYQERVQTKMRLLYSASHRKTRMALLCSLRFGSHDLQSQPLLNAIEFIKANKDWNGVYYPDEKSVPVKDVIPPSWLEMVVESTPSTDDGKVQEKINKLSYEVAVFEVLKAKLCTKAIWLEGAYRYRNPKEDKIAAFGENADHYFKLLDAPRQASDFTRSLKAELDEWLSSLNASILQNDKVKIMPKRKNKIKVTPSEPQSEPTNIIALKKEIASRWSGVSLLEMLKEADLRINFSRHLHTAGSHTQLSGEDYLKRLLLCLYAIGSNIGIKKCVDASNGTVSYADLRYIKRRFLNVANVREAIAEVINQLLTIRDPAIFGEATTGCACDSTHMQTWDQNLMSGYHPRYKKYGTMIYWHVDKKAACIYSQLKTCTSSEVASMLMGFLWHNTDMTMKECYADTHGQSLIGFAFCRLLNVDLLPRIKGIDKELLYYPSLASKNKYNNLTDILGKPIDWSLMEEHYEAIVHYAAALRIGAVEPEVIIRQFGKDNNSPVCKALMELGKVIKTIFLCRYLSSETLRIEINEALNVVERVNGVMDFIFYGKLSELSSHQRDEQELSVVCLHLLQVSMVYINTLMIQQILSEPAWKDRLTEEDKRALSPLIHTHINQFGLFILNLAERMAIETYSSLQQDKQHGRSNTNARQKKSSRISEAA